MSDKDTSGTKPTTTAPTGPRQTVPPTSTPRGQLDPAAATPLQGTRWTLTRTIEADGTYAVPTGVDAWIRIDDGELSGSGGCNRIRGAVEVTPPADRPGAEGTIVLGPLVATRMACIGDGDLVERQVLRVLDGTLRSFVDATTLTLERGDGLGLVFEAPPTCGDGTGTAPSRTCAGPAPTVGPGSPDDAVARGGTPPPTTDAPDSGGTGGGTSGSSGSGATVPLSGPPTSGRGLERPTSPPTEPTVPRPAD